MTEQNAQPAVLVVGSTGMIGTHLVRRFAEAFRVFALDIKEPEDALPQNATFMKIDVTSDDNVRQTLNKVRQEHDGPIASVIQLAAYYDFAGEPSDMYEKITVRGTERVLHSAKEINAEQFVFSSTMLVHAPTRKGQPFNEDQPLQAKWDYPQSKVDTEKIIHAEHGDLPTVLLRIAGVYSDACDSLPLSNQIQRIHERTLTSSVYPGDLAHGQAFVHIEDLVEAFWLTVTRRGELPKDVTPILIGEPETPGYGDVQQAIARYLHGESDWTTRQIPKTVAKSGAWVQDKAPGVEDPFIKPWMIDLADDHYELNIERARELLHWVPQHRVLSVIPKMIERLQQDPEGWYGRHNLSVPESVAGERR